MTSSNTAQLLNTIIDHGQIQLISVLGTGSFSTVYLGRHVTQGTEYAVKVLCKKSLTPYEIRMQRNEANILRRVNAHPNIVSLHKVIETRDYLFMVMEKAELDLYEAITSKNGFPQQVVKEVFDQLLDALIYCHSRGIYHRDIKPENALITSDFRIMLTDFGLSTCKSCAMDGCGSPRYMSPECITCLNCQEPDEYSTAANDVWSMGVLLINLISGKNPWHEATMSDVYYSAFHANHAILAEQFNLSPECAALFERVFEECPSKRCTLVEFKEMIANLPSFFNEPPLDTIPTPTSDSTVGTNEASAGHESEINTLCTESYDKTISDSTECAGDEGCRATHGSRGITACVSAPATLYREGNIPNLFLRATDSALSSIANDDDDDDDFAGQSDEDDGQDLHVAASFAAEIGSNDHSITNLVNKMDLKNVLCHQANSRPVFTS